MVSLGGMVLAHAALFLATVGLPGPAPDRDGYYRVAYDNCGVVGRQNHVQVGSPYAYPLRDIPARVVPEDDPARTVVFDGRSVVLRYQGLPPAASYRLVLTLLSDGPRRQRIVAGDRPLETHRDLRKGTVERLTYDVPPSAYAQGRLEVRVEREEGPNAVLSEAVLYATVPHLEPVLRLLAAGNLERQVRGRVLDLNRNTPVAGVRVVVTVPETDLRVDAETDSQGAFCLTVPAPWRAAAARGLQVRVRSGDTTCCRTLDAIELFGPRLLPRPTQTAGVRQPRVNLVGTWRFTPAAAADFPAHVDPAADLAKIEVPGEWVMQGFEVAPGQAAGYLREVEVPADFRGQRVILHCDAVYAEAEVWVNGERVGAHAGGMTAFQLDVTHALRPGRRNTVALKVTNDAPVDVLASGSQYAVHALGGITRKLYLQALPPTALTRLDVTTAFDPVFRDADLRVACAVENAGSRVFRGGSLRFRLYDGSGRPVRLSDPVAALATLAPGEEQPLRVTLPVSEPQSWDPEHPHLYELDVTLRENDRTLEVVRRRFGFRQVEVRGDRVFVNNRPIKLRGVNRHEVHPLRGRSLTPAQWRRDAELFRAAHVNYVRTSHYPPAEEFLDACDELGLFVECEAPLCWVQHGANPHWARPEWDYLDPNLYGPLLRANLETVAFHRRHPSIIIWSLANESRWSPLWARVLAAVERFDPTRLTSFHDQCVGSYNNAHSTAQIANQHYPGPGGPDLATAQERPLLFGEYCHLNAYNRYELAADPGLRDAWGRGFRAMWEAMVRTPGVLGGAIWAGIDDTFYLPSGATVGYGTWGLIDGWRRPKPEYYHVRKTYSPVHVSVSRLDVPPAGTPLVVPVENRYDFSNLRELTITWRIGTVTGRTQADVEPHEMGLLRIETGRTPLDGRTLVLGFTHPDRGEVDEVALPIGEPLRAEPPVVPPDSVGTAAALEERGDSFVIQGRTFRYTVERRSGQIRQALWQDRPVLVGGPLLLALPLNGQGGTQMTQAAQTFPAFTESCSARVVESVRARRDGGDVLVEVRDGYAEAGGGYRLRVDARGGLTVTYSYTMRQTLNPRQWGLVVTAPRDLDTLGWRRRGLWTVYPPDHIGRLQGTARAFAHEGRCGPTGPRTPPDDAWALDCTALGSNDFRSTKEHVDRATLTDGRGLGVAVVSDGTQHVRAWVSGGTIALLVAEYSNAGAERFFRRHALAEDRPLQAGDVIQGTVRLRLGSVRGGSPSVTRGRNNEGTP